MARRPTQPTYFFMNSQPAPRKTSENYIKLRRRILLQTRDNLQFKHCSPLLSLHPHLCGRIPPVRSNLSQYDVHATRWVIVDKSTAVLPYVSDETVAVRSAGFPEDLDIDCIPDQSEKDKSTVRNAYEVCCRGAQCRSQLAISPSKCPLEDRRLSRLG